MSEAKKIAVIGGDGTGPEVVTEGIKVLQAVAKLEGLKFDLTHLDWGAPRLRTTAAAHPGAVSATPSNSPASGIIPRGRSSRWSPRRTCSRSATTCGGGRSRK